MVNNSIHCSSCPTPSHRRNLPARPSKTVSLPPLDSLLEREKEKAGGKGRRLRGKEKKTKSSGTVASKKQEVSWLSEVT